METRSDPESVPVELPVGRRLDAAVERYGRDEVVERAIALLAGANAGEEFLLWAGGPHAQGVLDGAPPLYWPEVWGARALLHVWGAEASDAVRAGLTNPAWRVREMCARVAAAHEVDATELRGLFVDEVARVRAAGARAVGAVGEHDDIRPLESLLRDPEVDVRRSAGSALRQLRERIGG